ncbi:hypothetical protein GON01_03290 [Sphingomonas sp. MAH-20]|jgi:hypothetical protein|uniref:Lipoprotein n=1 Tax=Sphingomonas horti TaxID=2682842 RepID=A0A6I4IXP5_9SPHN|nr:MULTISPECIES: hypothetical protein [Sphingomonas]MBA2920976.1 hypothetical protein [Sphingomonas sp. CGMCC 1.13658]MVO76962.1 hypothetical protein [Sphingomonas horti]
MSARLLLLVPIALLAACDRKGDGAAVDIRSDNGSTQISAESGKEGRLKIDTPGVKADVKIPFLGALTGNMEIDGLRLYPDSKVAGIHVNADDDKNEGAFNLRFVAPAGRDKVAAWFQQQFDANDFKMTLQGNRFTGTSEEGKPVTLDMRDGANGTTEGELSIRDK